MYDDLGLAEQCLSFVQAIDSTIDNLGYGNNVIGIGCFVYLMLAPKPSSGFSRAIHRRQIIRVCDDILARGV